MSKYKDLLKDTVLFAISNFGSKLLSVLLIPLYVNVLSTEEYGTVDIITTTVNLILPVLSLSISSATIRFALEKDSSKDGVLSNSIVLIFFSTIIVLICSVLINIYLKANREMFSFFVIIYFLSGIHICLANFLKGSNRTKEFAIQGILQTATLIACNLLFLLVIKIGVTGYLLSIVISYMSAIAFMIIFGKIYTYKWLKMDKELMKKMLMYCVPLIPGTVAWWINTSADKYMIIAMYGIGQSGLYSIAHKVPTLLTMVTNIFLQAWQIAAINNFKEDNAKDFYNGVYSSFSFICLAVGIFLIFISEMIVRVAFNAEYLESWKLVPVLIVSAIFSSHSTFLSSVFSAAKKTKMLLKSVCVGAVVNIVLNYILLKLLGTIGAAVATMASFGVMWLIRLKSVQRLITINYNRIKMTVSNVLIIIGAFIMSYEWVWRYYVFSLISIAIMIIYRKDIKSMFEEIINALNIKIYKKEKAKGE